VTLSTTTTLARGKVAAISRAFSTAVRAFAFTFGPSRRDDLRMQNDRRGTQAPVSTGHWCNQVQGAAATMAFMAITAT
jgi:hypothetical protein